MNTVEQKLDNLWSNCTSEPTKDILVLIKKYNVKKITLSQITLNKILFHPDLFHRFQHYEKMVFNNSKNVLELKFNDVAKAFFKYYYINELTIDNKIEDNKIKLESEGFEINYKVF